MRKFLSKVLLVVFIFVFAFPASLLAQNNSWVPPAGPPLQNNTPSPVNIGSQPQTKRGNLTIQGIFEGRGINAFRENTTGTTPSSFTAAFTPFYFLNNVSVGNTTTFPTLDIYGTLKYKPPVTNIPNDPMGGQVGGQLGGQDGEGPTVYSGEPETGYVLTSIDDQGTVSWRPGLPTGGADGDTLIWNETCNCWTTGTGGGDANLPPGEAGQTLWFNGQLQEQNSTGDWEATNQINHDSLSLYNIPTMSYVDFARTSLNNPVIELNGSNSVKIGTLNQGQTLIRSNSVKINGIGGVEVGDGGALGPIALASPSVQVRPSPGVNQTLEVNSSDIRFYKTGAGSQNFEIRSNNVEYNDPSNNAPQNVTFNSSSVKFKGPISNPSLVNPGIGRIPYSVDEEGTFKWNENLVYGEEQIGGQNFGVLNVNNPDGGLALLRNNGYTNLLDDVVVGEEGQVFLAGLISGYLPEREQGLIKPLCYVETTKRIVNCNTDTITFNDNEIGDVFTPGLVSTLDGTITFTPDSPQQSYEFTHTGPITVKYCGGGGGGGGGGVGAVGEGGANGQGGSGGGGGSAATCSTENINVSPGDVLSWSIGEGGDGGAGGNVEINYFTGQATTNYNASSGGYGESTSVFLTPSGGTENQLGQTVIGGFPGTKGWSLRETTSIDPGNGLQLFGLSGNLTLQYGPWGWNGSRGAANTTAPCESCGGVGGWGEAFNSNGERLSNIDGTQPSARGGGGTPGGTDSLADRRGKNGRCGSLTFGGGGGGGGFGNVYGNGVGYYIMKGGNGGCGGDGYVRISGLPNYNGSNDDNQFVWTSPGTYTLTQTQVLNNIPLSVATVTVEVWGAGAGAGSVPGTLFTTKHSGGGGSGMYWKRENVPVQSLIGAQFVVGARGQNGISGNSSSMQSGSPGQPSTVNLATSPAIPSPNIIANGGQGGEPWTSSQTIDGGQGGESVTPSINGWVKTNGGDGTNGTTGNGCESLVSQNYGAGQGVQGFGNGAPRSCSNSLGNVFEGEASHGRIRISW